MRRRIQSQRGAVLLVALCFVTVIGIALASYVAASSRTLQISNRTAHTALSSHLAEMGLEEALRSFNANDWNDWSSSLTNVTAGSWSIDTTYNRATRTITLNSGKLGQGATGTIKIRVDNYNAAQVTSAWSSSSSYHLNDVVSYTDGMWYTCVQSASGSSQAPGNLSYWAPTPLGWKWASDITYSPYDLVCNNGVWYRCINSTSGATATPSLPTTWISGATYTLDSLVYYSSKTYRCKAASSFVSNTNPASDTTNWSSSSSTSYYWVPLITSSPWASGTSYLVSNGDVVSYGGVQYRCISDVSGSTVPSSDPTHWSTILAPISLSWSSGTNYSRGSLVHYSGSWYTCAYANNGNTPGPSSAYWTTLISPTSGLWNGYANYSVGDYAYNSGAWYRCTQAYTSANPSSWSASNWTAAAPYISSGWRPSTVSPSTFNFNDVVYYNGSWYRCKASTGSVSSTTSPASDTTNWENALTGSWAWVTAVNYNLNDVVNRNGTFYRCILAHTSATANRPPNTSAPYYWSTDPILSTSWDSGRYYNANDTVSYNGVWYRCLTAHSGSTPPSTSSNWSSTANSAWSATGSYNASSYVSYGGVWYKCILAPTANQSPNNSTYWTALGAPVIYAEGAISLLDGTAPIKTQLRATIAPAPLFPNAVGTTSTLTLGGAGTIDSYDSTSDPTASTRGYSATLASSYTSGTAINGGTGTVQGYLAAPSSASSPYAPLSSFNGTLKGTSSGTGLDLTRMSRSPYIPQFSAQTAVDHTALSTGGFANLTLGTPGAPTPSYYYVSGAMNLNIANEIVTIIGPVVLDLSTNLRIQTLAADKIIIASTGSAEIHFGGYLDVATTGGGITNSTKDPKKLILIGTGTSMAIAPNYAYNSASNPFYGVIYMPNSTSTLTLSAGDFYGAVSSKTVAFSGAANFHYDTSLRYAKISGVDQPYGITQWRELTDASELATMP